MRERERERDWRGGGELNNDFFLFVCLFDFVCVNNKYVSVDDEESAIKGKRRGQALL